MIAASGTETAPVAVPLTTPQSRKSCHGSVIPSVRSDETAITRERDRDDAAHAEALDERGGEGRAEAEAEEVERDGEADRLVAPAELVVQRDEEDAGRRAEARRT